MSSLSGEREEKKQAVKDDKVVRALATKGHRILDPMVNKFDAYSKKVSRTDDLEPDDVQAFETSKQVLSLWHSQCQSVLGKIAGGKTCAATDLVDSMTSP